MKKIIDIVQEDFKLKSKGSINTKNKYEFYPKTGTEFKEAVKSLVDKYGPGTKDIPLDLNSISIESMPWARNLLAARRSYGYASEHDVYLEYIDVRDWNLKGKDHIFGLFYCQRKLKAIYGLDTWDVSDCENFDELFQGCTMLETVDGIENWKIKPGAAAEHMFSGCKKLKLNSNLDNFKKARYKKQMFYDCPIESVPDWHMNAYKRYMHIK